MESNQRQTQQTPYVSPFQASQDRLDWEYTSECLDEVCWLSGGNTCYYSSECSMTPPTPNWMKEGLDNYWDSDDSEYGELLQTHNALARAGAFQRPHRPRPPLFTTLMTPSGISWRMAKSQKVNTRNGNSSRKNRISAKLTNASRQNTGARPPITEPDITATTTRTATVSKQPMTDRYSSTEQDTQRNSMPVTVTTITNEWCLTPGTRRLTQHQTNVIPRSQPVSNSCALD